MHGLSSHLADETGENREKPMIRKLTVTFLLLLSLTITATAQSGFGTPPYVPTLTRLRDDSLTNRIVIIREDGSYLVSFGIGALRIESRGALVRHGCAVTLAEQTSRYRVLITADACQGTGKATINYFNVGSYTITDRTAN